MRLKWYNSNVQVFGGSLDCPKNGQQHKRPADHCEAAVEVGLSWSNEGEMGNSTGWKLGQQNSSKEVKLKKQRIAQHQGCSNAPANRASRARSVESHG